MKLTKITNIDHRIRLAIIASICVIFILLSVFLIIIPAQSKMLETKQQIIDQKHQIEVNESSLTNLIIAQRRSDELTSQLDILNNAFVPKNNPLTVIGLFEELAEKRGIEVNITLTQPSDAVQMSVIPVQTRINITGDLISSLEFINDIYTEPYFINITDMSINAKSNDQSTQKDVFISINALMYWK
ncbi:MAG: hypothetical protein Q8P90_01305 [bacterium]|nr:hypothetical protein [bacterium]